MIDRYSVLDGRIAHSDTGTIPVDVYVMPDGDERAFLTDELGIDPHTLASSTDPDETPRIEFEDETGRRSLNGGQVFSRFFPEGSL